MRRLSKLAVSLGLVLATALCVGMKGSSDITAIAVVSDPTIHHFNIHSHGATLGISELGGGYANYLDLGHGKNLMAAAYGRGWQPDIRDQLHTGKYNPTQAGVSDPAGTPVQLSTRSSTNGVGQRVEIHRFPMALFLNPGFNFALPPWRHFPEQTQDTDGIDDSRIPLDQQLRSEFDMWGFFQDASRLANDTVPVFQFDFTMEYARDPGPPTWLQGHPYSAIYQFGTRARTEDGKPVLNPDARIKVGGSHFPAVLTSDIDLATVQMDAGIRLVYSAGYHTELWLDPQGRWQHASLNDTERMRKPFYGTDSEGSRTSFAVLATGDDPQRSPAIGLYVPQTSQVNAQQIVGTDIRTGRQLYTEDRRIQWSMNSNRMGIAAPGSKQIITYTVGGATIENHMTILRPVVKFTGLLAPGHGLRNAKESFRCEEFLIIGTAEQIRSAVAMIDKNMAAR